MVEYSKVVVNHGVPPSGGRDQVIRLSEGIFSAASATSLRNRGSPIDYLAHAQAV
jgi:hypothetical protein